MKQWFKKFFHRIIMKEKSPEKLAWSTCLGLFIAFSPFLGVQNLLILALSPLLRLNTAVVFMVAYLVNNPLTMIPIAVFDYMVGAWVFERLLCIPLSSYNPTWMQKFNMWLSKYFKSYLGDSPFCVWCYILGGLLVGFLLSIPWYTYIKRLYIKLLKKYENNYAK